MFWWRVSSGQSDRISWSSKKVLDLLDLVLSFASGRRVDEETEGWNGSDINATKGLVRPNELKWSLFGRLSSVGATG